MSAIKLHSDSGGSTTLVAAAKVSNTTVTLPDQSGTLATSPAYLVDNLFPNGFNSEASDCSTYIQAALGTFGAAMLTAGRKYKASNLQSVPNGRLVCLGGRATIVVPAGDGLRGITIDSTNFSLDGVDFDGGDQGPYNIVSATFGTRIGVLVGKPFGTSTEHFKFGDIQNCDITGFDASGIQIREIQVGFVFGKRLSLFNVNAHHNYINIWASPRAEYMTVTACYGYEGYAGVINQAGNNMWVGCHFENNFNNCQLPAGENDGHGSFIGCTFNHAAAGGYGLVANGIANGMVFSGCQFWFSPIQLTNCAGISVKDGAIGVGSPITIVGGGVNWIDDNFTPSGLSKTFTGYTFTSFRGNRISSTDVTIAPSSGDLNVQCTAITTAYPVAWNATTDTKLPLVASVTKWHGEDVDWLNPSNDIYLPITGWFGIDAAITFTVGAAAERVVLKATLLRASVDVYNESASAYGLASQTEVSVRLNTRVFALQGDVLRLSLKTLTATGITIPTGGIKVRVRSDL